MSKIGIDRLLEKGDIHRRKLAAEKLASERGNITLADRVNLEDNNSPALIPYFVEHSKFDNAYLQAITEEKLLRLFPTLNLNEKNIQYKGHDWTRKLSIKNELVVGDLVGIPAYLDGRNFDGKTALEELVNFGNVFKKGSLIEVPCYYLEKSRETDAITKSVYLNGSIFSAFTILKDCGYLVDQKNLDFKFKITGISRNKSPSIVLFAEPLEGQREARRRSLDLTNQPKKDWAHDFLNSVEESVGDSKREITDRKIIAREDREMSRTKPQLITNHDETLFVYKSNLKIEEGYPVWVNKYNRDDHERMEFERIRRCYSDSLTNVLVLYRKFGDNFTDGVMMTNEGSTPIELNKLDIIVPELVKEHGTNFIILTTTGNYKTPIENHVSNWGFNTRQKEYHRF